MGWPLEYRKLGYQPCETGMFEPRHWDISPLKLGCLEYHAVTLLCTTEMVPKGALVNTDRCKVMHISSAHISLGGIKIIKEPPLPPQREVHFAFCFTC